jgi:signal transduction histidine kinase/PAS domain-containing protein
VGGHAAGMGTSGTGAVLAGAVVLVLLVAAAVALYAGLRDRAAARASVRRAERLRAILAAAPMQLATVAADGSIELPPRARDWLGLAEAPRYVADLAGGDAGLARDEAAALQADLAACQRAGKPFARALRPQGSSRALLAHGHRAAGEEAADGAVLLWLFDATAAEDALDAAHGEAARYRAALEALSGLIEAAPLPMWYRGPDLKLAMANTAYVRAVEAADAGEVVARGLELVEAGGAGGPLAGAAAARDAGRPSEQTVPATVGGTRRSLRIVDVPLPTGGVAGYAIDAHELEQARADAKRFADAQRAMLDRLSAGVAQFGPDRALVFCNQPFRRLFAMRAEWLADRPEFDRVLERMREAGRLPEVRDFPGWKAERRDWFSATEGEREEQWHLAGGVHLRVLAQPAPDGGLVLIFEDRTEQVQLASARDTLLRVRTATFDNLFEALGVFAADGRLQLWNNRFRALWGVDEDYLAAHPRVDQFAAAVADRLANPARAGLIGELVRSATHERQQRGGRVGLADGRHFEFAAVPLPDGNALFTMLDISDSRRIEQALRDRNEALEAADRVKTRFVANMSYELRTPLTSISGFAEMLAGGYAGPLGPDAQGYVAAILDSTERLGLLVDDVLDLTSGGEELAREDVDLAEVARAAAKTLAPAIKRHRIDLALEVQRSVGRVPGDRRRLREAVEHLLRHAVGSVAEGGRVLLHADGNARTARIVVSDDGPGMDAETAARAFDRFALPGVAPAGERALGLGLPLAKQFVEAHGGSIALVSEPGAGTLVTIELPRR